jgi:hypothetical protein
MSSRGEVISLQAVAEAISPEPVRIQSGLVIGTVARKCGQRRTLKRRATEHDDKDPGGDRQEAKEASLARRIFPLGRLEPGEGGQRGGDEKSKDNPPHWLPRQPGARAKIYQQYQEVRACARRRRKQCVAVAVCITQISPIRRISVVSAGYRVCGRFLAVGTRASVI